eukprot:SAG11_NODE_1462_length_4866_cov_4.910216_3_plen_65_part_00
MPLDRFLQSLPHHSSAQPLDIIDLVLPHHSSAQPLDRIDLVLCALHTTSNKHHVSGRLKEIRRI